MLQTYEKTKSPDIQGKADIEFKKITSFPRGTLYSLLRDAYSFEKKFERDCFNQWREFDDFFYDNPHIADTCGFITTYDKAPIGFVSWNPTNIPVSAEIGHNCISTKYKGNGYGKRQMQEAVKRILAQGAEKIVVTTNEILVSAQHTYESSGFRFIRKKEEPFYAEYAGMRMDYEIVAR
ncbi:MAG: GNAT family N-acetyltransferase [Lachnospiraceae bacterium]|nr:GNAT family N-acetyltransferase [Lachnospiraceae bacterium]MCI9675593.1 GNAT family N-acetyltransferase [Lachnospiraceae bacterium]